MKKFEWVDHPSDIGFRAYGRDLCEAFENAALALTEILVDTSKVEKRRDFEIKLDAEDEKALLYDWLEWFLYFHDAEGIVMSEFKVEEFSRKNDSFRIKAKVRGEPFDPERHAPRTEVKAITYHMMEIKRGKEHSSVQVIVDI